MTSHFERINHGKEKSRDAATTVCTFCATLFSINRRGAIEVDATELQ